MSDQPARPFSHLDAPNAELYRGVMGAFVAAKRRFLVHLRPEDVVESLREAGGDEGGPPLDGAAMEAALKQLEQWGNLRADLERFIGDLVVKSAEIVTTLRDLESQPGTPASRALSVQVGEAQRRYATGSPDGPGVEGLLALAAAREAADAAPDQRDADEALRAKLDGWRARWSGLRSWFLGDRAHPSQAALLRQRARAAIPALLAAVTTLQERRTGRSDRSADFRALARWFAEAPSDAEAHRLWRAAFGLASARHLGIDAGTLEAREEQPVPAATAWAEAPPVTISPRLRSTGRHQHRGTLARIVDRSQARRRLEELLVAERVQTEAARRRLAPGRPTRLSDRVL